MRRLSLLALAAALAPLSCSLFEGVPQPNFVLITVSGLRYDAISHSLGAAETPHLQALRAESLGFTHCYSHSPVSLPAHVALHSARLPSSTGVSSGGQAIDREVTLLAELMKHRGYATAASISLAGLQTPEAPPPKAGGARTPRNEQPTGLERGFDVYSTGEGQVATGEDVNARLFAALDALPAGSPRFLFTQYSMPGLPVDAWNNARAQAEFFLAGRPLGVLSVGNSQDWRMAITVGPGRHELMVRSTVDFVVRRLECRSEAPGLRVDDSKLKLGEHSKRVVIRLENTTAAPITCSLSAWIHDVPSVSDARAHYRQQIEALDHAVGELIAGFKSRGIYEDTLIVLTADHGMALGEHGRISSGHGLYDELLRIPLMFKPSRGFEDGAEMARLENKPLRQIDIVPTALDLLGMRGMPGADGLSVFEETDRTLYAEVHPPEAEHSLFCLRDTRYKMILTAGENRFELYDVVADTLEGDDIFELQGHFRSAWQSELRSAASNSAQAVNARMSLHDKRQALPRSRDD